MRHGSTCAAREILPGGARMWALHRCRLNLEAAVCALGTDSIWRRRERLQLELWLAGPLQSCLIVQGLAWKVARPLATVVARIGCHLAVMRCKITRRDQLGSCNRGLLI